MKLGQKVKIKKDSIWAYQSKRVGEIIEVDKLVFFSYTVKFTDGFQDYYREKDLELVSKD